MRGGGGIPENASFLQWNGNGTFQSPVTFVRGITSGISDVQWADLNGDGRLDFVVEAGGYSLAGGYTYVLLAKPRGGFTQTDFQSLCADCYLVSYFALGDLNGDGYPDLVIGSETGDMGLYLNNGKGSFTLNQTLLVSGLLGGAPAPVIMDFNGDGILDVGVSDGTDFAILPNEGNAVFKQADYFGQTGFQFYLGNWHGQAATIGKPDIFIPDGSGTGQMLVNITK